METKELINIMEDNNISIGSDTENHEESNDIEYHTYSVDTECEDDTEDYLTALEEAINDKGYEVDWLQTGDDTSYFSVYKN